MAFEENIKEDEVFENYDIDEEEAIVDLEQDLTAALDNLDDEGRKWKKND